MKRLPWMYLVVVCLLATTGLIASAGIIALLGHPISVGTSMITCIALGAGVDFAIHLGFRARSYGERAICAKRKDFCGVSGKPFDEFVAHHQAAAIGSRLWDEYGRWPMYSKFFDNQQALPFHFHQVRVLRQGFVAET